MNRILVIAVVAICGAATNASAQSGKYQIGDMQVTTLTGAYQFRDPETQDLLRGYIEEAPGTAREKPAPTDMVNFRICNTRKVLHIEFQKLTNGPPCRSPGHGPWQAWMIQNDKLVASGPPGEAAAAVVNFSDLPANLQSILKAGNPDKVRAFSFPSQSGTTASVPGATKLGIITEPAPP